MKGMRKMLKDVIAITGGDGKIASSIVERYLKDGSKVIAIDRKENTEKKQFLSNPNYEYYQADVTDVKQLIEIKNKIEKKEGKITHLISAAGCPMKTEIRGLEEVTIEDIDESIKLNLNAHIYCTKIFLPLLEKETSKNKSIIMISSDLPELLGMADRIYVMSEGKITGELSREEATQVKIMGYATANHQEG